jgi:acetyl-CoA acetyltransferase
VNRVFGSGVQAIISAAHDVLSGSVGVTVAGGMTPHSVTPVTPMISRSVSRNRAVIARPSASKCNPLHLRRSGWLDRAGCGADFCAQQFGQLLELGCPPVA